MASCGVCCHQTCCMRSVMEQVLIALLAVMVFGATNASAAIESATALPADDSQSIATIPFREYGVVEPEDPLRFAGERFQLNCTITNPELEQNSSSLFFERKTSKGTIALGTDLVQLIDSRTISFTLNTVSPGDEGVYTCWMRSNSSGKLRDKIVGQQILRVDYAPQIVQNFTCDIYNWQEMMCTWELGVKFRHPNQVKVDVYYSIGQVHYACHEQSETSCFWDYLAYKQEKAFWVQVNVSYNVKERIKSKAKSLFLVETFIAERPTLKEVDFKVNFTYVQALVRPAPVQNLTGWAESDSCILLTWRYPYPLSMEKTFVGHIMSLDSGEILREVTLNVTSNDPGDRFSRQSLVCDLQPHNLYSFRVAVKPFFINATGKFQLGYTSEWRETKVPTEQGVPDAAPEVCPGCYFEVTRANGKRNVEIIWKDIHKDHRRGKLIHYNVTYTGLQSHTCHNVVSLMSQKGVPKTSVLLVLPSFTEDFLVEIRGATVAGLSPVSARIIVPALGKVSKAVPDHLQEMWVERSAPSNEALKLFLSWTLAQGQEVATTPDFELYLVWCKGSRLDFRCQESVGWIQLPRQQLWYEHDSDMAEFDPNQLLIGIATEVKDTGGKSFLSSGISWNACLYSRNQKPSLPPRNLRVFQNDQANGLSVVWERYGCLKEPIRVVAFLVYYWCINPSVEYCSETKQRKVYVNGDTTEAVLPDLDTGLEYLIRVMPRSPDGLGPASNSTFIYTGANKSGSNTLQIISAVVAVTGILLVTICLACTALRYRKKKKKMPNVLSLLDQPERADGRRAKKDQNRVPAASEHLPLECNANTPLLGRDASDQCVASGQDDVGIRGASPVSLDLSVKTEGKTRDSGVADSNTFQRRSNSSSTVDSASSYQLVAPNSPNKSAQRAGDVQEDAINGQTCTVALPLSGYCQLDVPRPRHRQIPPQQNHKLVFHVQIENNRDPQDIPVKSKVVGDEQGDKIPQEDASCSRVLHKLDNPHKSQCSSALQHADYVDVPPENQSLLHDITHTPKNLEDQCLLQENARDTNRCVKQCLNEPSEYVTIASIAQCESMPRAAVGRCESQNMPHSSVKPYESENMPHSSVKQCQYENMPTSSVKKSESDNMPQAVPRRQCEPEHFTHTEVDHCDLSSAPSSRDACKSLTNEHLHSPATDPTRGVEFQHQTSHDSGHSSPQADDALIHSPFNLNCSETKSIPSTQRVSASEEITVKETETANNTSSQLKEERVDACELSQCQEKRLPIADSEQYPLSELDFQSTDFELQPDLHSQSLEPSVASKSCPHDDYVAHDSALLS